MILETAIIFKHDCNLGTYLFISYFLQAYHISVHFVLRIVFFYYCRLHALHMVGTKNFGVLLHLKVPSLKNLVQ